MPFYVGLLANDNPVDTAPLTHSCHRRAPRARGPSGASVPAGPCKRPGSRSSRRSCPPPGGSSGTQLWERCGEAEAGGREPGGGRGAGGGGGAQGRCGNGSGQRSSGSGLTIVGVDAQLDFPLNGGLDLLLPHTLDAQVVKAVGGGGCHEGAGVALTHRRAPADATCVGTVSGAEVPGPRGPSLGVGCLGFKPSRSVKDS